MSPREKQRAAPAANIDPPASDATPEPIAPYAPPPPEPTKADLPAAAPPAPPVQISVKEWAQGKIAEVGFETAGAFVRTYGRGTDTASNLTRALAEFLRRPV